MRVRLRLFTIALFLCMPVLAQDTEFPTLDELANLEVPGYDYADVVRRLSWVDIRHTPPSEPPVYEIGDTKTFRVPSEEDPAGDPVTMVLRGMTDNVLVWIDEAERLSDSRTQWLAEEIDDTIVKPMQQLFDYAEPPGVDGDPRLYVVLVRRPESNLAGFFPMSHALPRSVWSKSNQQEMLVVNLSNNDKSDVFDPYFISTVAHEYQHVLLFHRDFSEEKWLNEALSTYVMQNLFGFEIVGNIAEQFLSAPQTALTRFNLGENIHKHYGAGMLFTIFLAEQFGSPILRDIHAERANGWRSIEKVLRQRYGTSIDDVFADWVLANYFLDADRGFGYSSISQPTTSPEPIATIRTFPALETNDLTQFSTDYYAVNVQGAEQLKLRLIQSPEAHLIQSSPFEGEQFYYAVTNGFSASKLTRQFDLRQATRAELEFRVWFDLEEQIEFGYVQATDDGGVTWQILTGQHTTDNDLHNHHFDDGYTGNSDGWLQETISLRRFEGRSVLLRFELLSNSTTNYRGMAIDDLRIDAIDYHDGFESPDKSWHAEGWIRTDNRLPQRTWVQVVQDGPDGLTLNRFLQTSSAEMTIDLLPGVNRAVVAVSPVVPLTSLDSQYSLEFNLIDEAGQLMFVSRDCTVTTTAGLNFRDAPNGNKIGLVLAGTAATALDRQGDWFQVEYDDTLGWISASYVTMRGDCN